MKAIKVSDVSFSYSQEVEALRSISFSVSSGESVGLVGPNGAGKSTLLLLLAGLLQPEKGHVEVFGVSTSSRGFSETRRRIGVVFQDPDDQLFNSTVLGDVIYAPVNVGVPRKEAEALAYEALLAVNALHLKDRRPHRLSFGEKRRVAIATALVLKPDLLILDEPTANLDLVSRLELMDLLRRLNSGGTTVVISTHDMDALSGIVNRVIMMDAGCIVGGGDLREVLADEVLLATVGMKPPDIVRLYLMLREIGLSREPVYSVEEAYDDLKARLKPLS